MKIKDAVFNKKHNTIGIVREIFDKGEIRTDADGVVNIGDVEIYDPANITHIKAQFAPSTKREYFNLSIEKLRNAAKIIY